MNTLQMVLIIYAYTKDVQIVVVFGDFWDGIHKRKQDLPGEAVNTLTLVVVNNRCG